MKLLDYLTATRTRTFVGACGMIFAATVVALAIGLRICTTPSLPVGVWRAVDAPVVRGVVVLVCLPEPTATLASSRGYIGAGQCPDGRQPLGKSVLAIRGDTVSVSDAGLALNGRPLPRTTRLPRDSEGRALPRVAAGIYVVRAGDIWLVAPDHRRSFDSRYFGPVPTGNVRSTLRPVMVWERGSALPRFGPESPSITDPRTDRGG